MSTPLTGRRVLVIAIAAFGAVIAANVAMLVAATGTFPGLVVENSYVASQGWNARTDAQRDLGWQADIAYADGTLAIRVTGPDGLPARATRATVEIGRPSTDAEDRRIELAAGALAHELALDLAPGGWRVTVNAVDPAYEFSRLIVVRGGN